MYLSHWLSAWEMTHSLLQQKGPAICVEKRTQWLSRSLTVMEELLLQSLDMCMSFVSTVEWIFSKMQAVLDKRNILWANCVGIVLDNT